MEPVFVNTLKRLSNLLICIVGTSFRPTSVGLLVAVNSSLVPVSAVHMATVAWDGKNNLANLTAGNGNVGFINDSQIGILFARCQGAATPTPSNTSCSILSFLF